MEHIQVFRSLEKNQHISKVSCTIVAEVKYSNVENSRVFGQVVIR